VHGHAHAHTHAHTHTVVQSYHLAGLGVTNSTLVCRRVVPAGKHVHAVNVALAKIYFVAIWVKERLTDRCCQLTGATAGGTQHTVTLTHLRTGRPFPDAPRLKRPAVSTARTEQRQLCVLGTAVRNLVSPEFVSPRHCPPSDVLLDR